MIPLVSIVGRSGVGKTTLIEKLVPELKSRGFRVAVVKHHAHATPIDAPGKDSARYAAVGADMVLVSSPVELARFERVERELTLAEIAARIENVDLILTEGFKRQSAPQIEVLRAGPGADLPTAPREARDRATRGQDVPGGAGRGDAVIAVASDRPLERNLPCFDLNDAHGLASFIIAHFGLNPPDEP